MQTAQPSVYQVFHWLYEQMGLAGLALFGTFCLGLIFCLLYWQMNRMGISRVAGMYLIGIATLTGLHFLGTQGNGPSRPLQGVVREQVAEQGDTSLVLRGVEERLVSSRSRLADEAPEPRRTPFWQWMHTWGYPLLLWGTGIGILVALYRLYPSYFSVGKIASALTTADWIRPERSKTNELGSSDLATAGQLKRWTKRNGKYDTVLPVNDLRGNRGIALKSGNLVIPIAERNRHVLIVAKTGSGKTTKLILPILYGDCMCHHRSTIVIDSKQEMWQKLAAMTKKYNPEKNVVLFNPLDRARSQSWNILAKVESDTDCKLIANSVIMATDEPQARQDSPFFRNSALQVLNAVMVGLLEDPSDRLSMPRIHELTNQGMLSLCDWIEAHPVALRTTKAFVELARSGSQNADTIMSELSMRLQAWDLIAIRATTFQDEVNIERIIKEPTTFVIELRESELKMLRPLANVIVVEMLRYLTKYAEECQGQTLPRPVSLVIDEFASALGRLPDIHVKLNTLRSRNVSIVAAIQSIGQIKGNYGEDWESVLSGFNTKVFMPSLDYMDSEWASKESGIMTIRYRTSSKGTNRKIVENFANRNISSNEQIQQRQVLTPGEIGRPSDNQATFFLPETPVFQGHLVPYYKLSDMNFRINEFNSPEKEVKLREAPIEYEERLPEPAPKRDAAPHGGHSMGTPIPGGQPPMREERLSQDQLWASLEDIKINQLDWENTTGDARKWWEAFEEENKTRIALVVKVAQEIARRGATITDFFLAYVYSNTDNIQATLAYLDYTMHLKSANAGTNQPPSP